MTPTKEEWQRKGEGHRQRLRDKFLDRGLDSFPDDEVLELLLTFGTPRSDCKELARSLLARFGSLAAVLEASQAELLQVRGLGAKNGFALHFVQAVARRYLAHRLKAKDYLRSSREVGDYLIHALRDLRREVFVVIFLDASYGIIATETIAEGTLTSNTIYPRELIRLTLQHHAAAVVVAHNHPSGNPAPSPEDRRLTRSLYLACAVVQIQLLDHLIVAGSDRPYSFAEAGLMAEIKTEVAALL